MRLIRLLVPVVCLCAVLAAETRMTVAQLRAFITSSVRLRHPDRQVADFLKNVKLTQQLTAGTVEDLAAEGAGPRTAEVLRRMVEQTKSLQPPPPPPRPAVVQQIPPPPAVEQARVLNEIREYAREYTRSLPNFICVQVARRYVDPAGMEFWRQMDVVTTKLSFFEQKEDYKVIAVNNRYVDAPLERVGGFVTRGEFGTQMKEIFAPETNARFEWERWATLRGRRMHVYAFRVPQPNSKLTVAFGNQHATPGYTGLIYADRDTSAIMRIVIQIDDLPPGFPVNNARQIIDYDFQKISDNEYLVPLKTSSVMRAGRELMKNEIEFRMYNRFGAEATITFAPEPLPEEQFQEEGEQQPGSQQAAPQPQPPQP
jgi:hypothetical protein